jgi:hypothetical protein
MMIVLVENDMQLYQPTHKLAYNCKPRKTIPGMESE